MASTLKKKNYLFCLYWVFVAACGLSLAEVSGSYSSLWCSGFSWCYLLLSQCTGSKAGRLLQLWHHSTWNLPGPGVEPLSLALAGRFFPTGPPGKSCSYLGCCSVESLDVERMLVCDKGPKEWLRDFFSTQPWTPASLHCPMLPLAPFYYPLENT